MILYSLLKVTIWSSSFSVVITQLLRNEIGEILSFNRGDYDDDVDDCSSMLVCLVTRVALIFDIESSYQCHFD